jgi:hypothetical protein
MLTGLYDVLCLQGYEMLKPQEIKVPYNHRFDGGDKEESMSTLHRQASFSARACEFMVITYWLVGLFGIFYHFDGYKGGGSDAFWVSKRRKRGIVKEELADRQTDRQTDRRDFIRL